MRKLKQQGQNWVQSNRSNVLGNLVETFNTDLESNRGVVRFTRSKRIATGNGGINAFGPVAAIKYFSNTIRVFTGTQSGDNLYNGGNSPFDSLTSDTDSTDAAFDDGDAVGFNAQLITANGDNLYRWNGAGSKTEIGTNALTENTYHLLEKFTPDGNGERAYVTEDDDKVWSISQANALASSGSYTLDLGLEPDYQITVLMAGEQSLWVGLSSSANNSGGGRSIIVEWDGVTENTPSRKFFIEASRIMSGVVKDDVPYLVDSRGRLLVFTGAGFKEIDKFPLKKDQTFLRSTTNMHVNAIHPRGMAVDGDEILICVSNLQDGSSGTTARFNDFPAGVWAWNERNGLHHRLSPSYQAVADTGTTNLTDYGQFRAAYGGPISVFEINQPDTSDGGRIVFAMSYFLDSGTDLTAATDIQYGLWTDDTKDNTQKAGYFITPQIHSDVFRDNWEEVYASLSALVSSAGDLALIKYRTTDEEPTYANITWKSNQTFHTTTDLSDFTQGDDVQVIQGKASGTCRAIKTLPSGIGITVTLDEPVTGVSDGDTSVIKIQKFRKAGSITGLKLNKMTIPKKANYIQFKVYMQVTGEKEFYNLLINNSTSISG